ncbi:hypothetical protein LR48_Vigan10g113500 [Vigna angularis]|uniref:Uncharacterized protein n=1 Tax=Phaseolus angularis TaxID=3914 RepID=A0A0L9VJS7_PHAAN|nr:hypothetical protein LR48_Vigan10g113500 [Vigna angularis]
MFDSSMYPFHPKLPGAAPCLCPLHYASCTGVTPRPRLRARVSQLTPNMKPIMSGSRTEAYSGEAKSLILLASVENRGIKGEDLASVQP